MAPLNFDVLIEDKKKPVYVVNNTNPASIVSLSLSDASGKRIQGEIPKTWIPICLTDLFPRRILRDSVDIHAFLSKGIIKLVTPEKAEALLSQMGAKEELSRLQDSKMAKRGGGNYSKASKDMRDAKKDADRLTKDAEARSSTSPGDDGEDSLVSDSIVDICNRLTSKDEATQKSITSSIEGLNELKRMRNALGEDDLQYILVQIDNKNIKNFAKEVLADLTGTGVSDEDNTENTKKSESDSPPSEDPQSDENDDSSDEEDTWEDDDD